MEQGVYDKIADYLSVMARTELLTCAAINNSFTTVNNQVSQVRVLIKRKFSSCFFFLNKINLSTRVVF